jgi:ABC-type multidrug transport system permease subunit
MKQQTYANHSKLVLGFHGILFLLMIVFLIGSIMNLLKSTEENLYSAALLVLVPVILFMLSYYVRAFALKAQDRAIRAEEKLRYFVLTGNSMNEKLSTRQIIGLRFASDDEFVDLAKRALDDNLSEKEIKKEIINWKADNYRV